MRLSQDSSVLISSTTAKFNTFLGKVTLRKTINSWPKIYNCTSARSMLPLTNTETIRIRIWDMTAWGNKNNKSKMRSLKTTMSMNTMTNYRNCLWGASRVRSSSTSNLTMCSTFNWWALISMTTTTWRTSPFKFAWTTKKLWLWRGQSARTNGGPHLLIKCQWGTSVLISSTWRTSLMLR